MKIASALALMFAAFVLALAPAHAQSLGYQQSASFSSATNLPSIPNSAREALVCIEGNAVRWRDDGVAPTATVGTPIAAGQCQRFTFFLGQVQFIPETGSATADVTYYGTSAGSDVPNGGGGGGGGGGGPVTVADGSDVALGATSDAAASAGGTGTLSAKLRELTQQIATLIAGVNAPMPCSNATAYNTNSYTTGGTNPIICDLNGNLYVNSGMNRWGGSTLGAPSNYGTSPGAVSVPGVNAFVTNTPTVTPQPTTGNGCTPYHLSGGTTASNNSTNVKNAAGTLCRFTVISTSATLAYLKVYDSASAPTCSSATNLKHVYPIPAGVSGGGAQVFDSFGEKYGNGISFCVTGGGGDTDNSNAPTGVFVEGSYS